MIIRIFWTVIVFMTFHVAVSAQYYTISADSLLKLIQAEGNVYETIENKISVSSVDTKKCYFNDSLKTVLLKLLDEDEYVRQDNLRILNRYFGTDEKKKIRVGEWVYDRYLSLEKDSFNGNPRQYDRYIQSFIQDYVMSNDSVYNLYLDSAYTDKIHRLERVKTVVPPYFEDLLSEIKWPEVYEAYYKDWVSDGKGIHSKRFKSMLRMHCPEAIELYNTYADEIYAKNDYSLFEGGILDRLDTHVYGSYAYQLMAKALSCLAICNVFDVYEDGFVDDEYIYPEVPFNLIVAKDLFNNKIRNEELICIADRYVRIGIYSITVIYRLNCCLPEETYLEAGREIKANVGLFRQELLYHMKQKEKEELYWKRNMPYYKSEKDDKETRE